MVRTQLVVLALVVAFCGSNAEARGRRGMYQQPVYQQYYTPQYNMPQYNTMTTTAAVAPAATAPTSTIVQTNAVESTNGVVQATATAPATTAPATAATAAAAPKVVTVGSAQWKAEQSARMGSVAHIGGGFGGGSHEGNGFGATPDQAIRNACYWGQLTPIEIGVARGANGYYATIFYR